MQDSERGPIYFQRWMWQVACLHDPLKYSMREPRYQGRRVVLT